MVWVVYLSFQERCGVGMGPVAGSREEFDDGREDRFPGDSGASNFTTYGTECATCWTNRFCLTTGHEGRLHATREERQKVLTMQTAPTSIGVGPEACGFAQRFLHGNCRKRLTSHTTRLKYRSIRMCPRGSGRGVMNTIQPANITHSYPQSENMVQPCRHPRVQVVSRDQDAEFVECLECREIFESSEFRDMDIEDKIPTDEE